MFWSIKGQIAGRKCGCKVVDNTGRIYELQSCESLGSLVLNLNDESLHFWETFVMSAT